jgi:translation elongation factor EF-Ts
MDPSLTISSYLEQASIDSGKDIQIEKFIRYELGE